MDTSDVIITVKDVQEKSKDGSTWLELLDENNRTHRIFRRIQDKEGNWHDLSNKYEMLRNSQNRMLKLTTEQKGKFTNVLDVEMIEGVAPAALEKTAEEKDQECRLRTFTTAYAKDLAVADKIPVQDILKWSELFYRYLQGEIIINENEIKDLLQAVKATGLRG
ncbi:MAG: hypothetical protein NUV31_07080 [Dehalococcoidales bacterium]|jgi:hypothetical protein|nr:hypothetical protein [Dehalococcoidales bacterium]